MPKDRKTRKFNYFILGQGVKQAPHFFQRNFNAQHDISIKFNSVDKKMNVEWPPKKENTDNPTLKESS
jgi:hypothetical protein